MTLKMAEICDCNFAISDYVFDQDCSNQEVFDCMAKHIVEACIKGFNGTIFAYGQTSSGMPLKYL